LSRSQKVVSQLAHVGRPADNRSVTRGSGKADAGTIGGDETDVEFGEKVIVGGHALEARTLKTVEVENWDTAHASQRAAIAGLAFRRQSRILREPDANRESAASGWRRHHAIAGCLLGDRPRA
jgi:hypothetical protein